MSPRGKIRRKAFSRRTNRSISLRFRSSRRSEARGAPRGRGGGDHGGESPLPSQRAGGGGLGGPVHEQRPPRRRPSGASGACPGDTASVRAVRASAATRCRVVVPPPRAGPLAGGPFFSPPRGQRDGPSPSCWPTSRPQGCGGRAVPGAATRKLDPSPRAWPHGSGGWRLGAPVPN